MNVAFYSYFIYAAMPPRNLNVNVLYCEMHTRCWATAMKQNTRQLPFLGSDPQTAIEELVFCAVRLATVNRDRGTMFSLRSLLSPYNVEQLLLRELSLLG
jgi:hypothetical protein